MNATLVSKLGELKEIVGKVYQDLNTEVSAERAIKWELENLRNKTVQMKQELESMRLVKESIDNESKGILEKAKAEATAMVEVARRTVIDITNQRETIRREIESLESKLYGLRQKDVKNIKSDTRPG